MITENQKNTYKNHSGSAVSYNTVSLFSLQPPELFAVFTNPVDYYRICYIDKKVMKIDDIEVLLTRVIRICSWVDCLGCQVKIRDIGTSKLKGIIRTPYYLYLICKKYNLEAVEVELRFNRLEVAKVVTR